jgi:hypothetical protein
MFSIFDPCNIPEDNFITNRKFTSYSNIKRFDWIMGRKHMLFSLNYARKGTALKGNNSGKTNCFRISLEMCRLSFWRYNWNIVESGVEHHNNNPNQLNLKDYYMYFRVTASSCSNTQHDPHRCDKVINNGMKCVLFIHITDHSPGFVQVPQLNIVGLT